MCGGSVCCHYWMRFTVKSNCFDWRKSDAHPLMRSMAEYRKHDIYQASHPEWNKKSPKKKKKKINSFHISLLWTLFMEDEMGILAPNQVKDCTLHSHRRCYSTSIEQYKLIACFKINNLFLCRLCWPDIFTPVLWR